MVGSPSGRDVRWLASAVDSCSGFPAAARRRIGCELECVRRWGAGRLWESVRGVAGAACFAVPVRTRDAVAQIYRVVAATHFPDVFTVVHAANRELIRGRPPLPQRGLEFIRARLLDVALDRQDRRPSELARAPIHAGEQNVFATLGFCGAEADELLERAGLIAELRHALQRRAPDGHVSAVSRAVIESDIDAVCKLDLERLAERLGKGPRYAD